MPQYSLFDFFEPRKPTSQVAPAPAVTLRPYQTESVDCVFAEWESGVNTTLVCLPTGCGKSVVFSEVMRRICEQVKESKNE